MGSNLFYLGHLLISGLSKKLELCLILFIFMSLSEVLYTWVYTFNFLDVSADLFWLSLMKKVHINILCINLINQTVCIYNVIAFQLTSYIAILNKFLCIFYFHSFWQQAFNNSHFTNLREQYC